MTSKVSSSLKPAYPIMDPPKSKWSLRKAVLPAFIYSLFSGIGVSLAAGQGRSLVKCNFTSQPSLPIPFCLDSASPFLNYPQGGWDQLDHPLADLALAKDFSTDFPLELGSQEKSKASYEAIDRCLGSPEIMNHPELKSILVSAHPMSQILFLNAHSNHPRFNSLLAQVPDVMREVYKLLKAVTLPDEISRFLEQYRDELIQMEKTQKVTGEWILLGGGSSKRVVYHPSLPQFVIKIPVSDYKTKDFLIHFYNMQRAKRLIAKKDFQYLIVPDCYLIPTQKLIVETRFDSIELKEEIRLIDESIDESCFDGAEVISGEEDSLRFTDPACFFSAEEKLARDRAKAAVAEAEAAAAEIAAFQSVADKELGELIGELKIGDVGPNMLLTRVEEELKYCIVDMDHRGFDLEPKELEAPLNDLGEEL